MSESSKIEARLLSHEDRELVGRTRHPALHAQDAEALRDLRQRLRALRDRERTLLHQKRREMRGKAEARGGSFPGLADHPGRRKQLFAQALKRVNSAAHRLRSMAARARLAEAARRALAMRESGARHGRPDNVDTPRRGPRPIPSRRSRSHVPGGRIGAVSQANKRAQAARDGRDTRPPEGG